MVQNGDAREDECMRKFEGLSEGGSPFSSVTSWHFRRQ